MGIYGNMVQQKDILSFVIQESENFNSIYESEVVQELSKKLTVSIKEKIVKLFDMFIKFCEKIINNIKRIFGKKIIETNKKKAVEVSKKVDQIELKQKEINNKEDVNETKDKDEVQGLFSKLSTEFLYKVYSNKYVFINTKKLAVEEKDIKAFNIFFQRIKELVEQEFEKSKNMNDQYGADIEFELVSKAHVLNRDIINNRHYSYMSSRFVQNKLSNIEDIISFDKTKNMIESILDEAEIKDINIIKNILTGTELQLWNQTHYDDYSISITSFPHLYKKYCDEVNENIKIYTNKISEFKDMISKLKTIVLRFMGHDYDSTSQFKHLSHKFHYDEGNASIIENFIKCLDFNVLYFNYMIELNMKGIQSGAALLPYYDKFFD